MAESVSYAPIADRYESVRGGAGRADALAAAVDRWLPAGVVCDVGGGTGIVTERLTRPDRRLVALDLSIEMLCQAVPRLPGRVAVAELFPTRTPPASEPSTTPSSCSIPDRVDPEPPKLERVLRALRHITG